MRNSENRRQGMWKRGKLFRSATLGLAVLLAAFGAGAVDVFDTDDLTAEMNTAPTGSTLILKGPVGSQYTYTLSSPVDLMNKTLTIQGEFPSELPTNYVIKSGGSAGNCYGNIILNGDFSNGLTDWTATGSVNAGVNEVIFENTVGINSDPQTLTLANPFSLSDSDTISFEYQIFASSGDPTDRLTLNLIKSTCGLPGSQTLKLMDTYAFDVKNIGDTLDLEYQVVSSSGDTNDKLEMNLYALDCSASSPLTQTLSAIVPFYAMEGDSVTLDYFYKVLQRTGNASDRVEVQLRKLGCTAENQKLTLNNVITAAAGTTIDVTADYNITSSSTDPADELHLNVYKQDCPPAPTKELSLLNGLNLNIGDTVTAAYDYKIMESSGDPLDTLEMQLFKMDLDCSASPGGNQRLIGKNAVNHGGGDFTVNFDYKVTQSSGNVADNLALKLYDSVCTATAMYKDFGMNESAAFVLDPGDSVSMLAQHNIVASRMNNIDYELYLNLTRIDCRSITAYKNLTMTAPFAAVAGDPIRVDIPYRVMQSSGDSNDVLRWVLLRTGAAAVAVPKRLTTSAVFTENGGQPVNVPLRYKIVRSTSYVPVNTDRFIVKLWDDLGNELQQVVALTGMSPDFSGTYQNLNIALTTPAAALTADYKVSIETISAGNGWSVYVDNLRYSHGVTLPIMENFDTGASLIWTETPAGVIKLETVPPGTGNGDGGTLGYALMGDDIVSPYVFTEIIADGTDATMGSYMIAPSPYTRTVAAPSNGTYRVMIESIKTTTGCFSVLVDDVVVQKGVAPSVVLVNDNFEVNPSPNWTENVPGLIFQTDRPTNPTPLGNGGSYGYAQFGDDAPRIVQSVQLLNGSEAMTGGYVLLGPQMLTVPPDEAIAGGRGKYVVSLTGVAKGECNFTVYLDDLRFTPMTAVADVNNLPLFTDFNLATPPDFAWYQDPANVVGIPPTPTPNTGQGAGSPGDDDLLLLSDELPMVNLLGPPAFTVPLVDGTEAVSGVLYNNRTRSPGLVPAGKYIPVLESNSGGNCFTVLVDNVSFNLGIPSDFESFPPSPDWDDTSAPGVLIFVPGLGDGAAGSFGYASFGDGPGVATFPVAGVPVASIVLQDGSAPAALATDPYTNATASIPLGANPPGIYGVRFAHKGTACFDVNMDDIRVSVLAAGLTISDDFEGVSLAIWDDPTPVIVIDAGNGAAGSDHYVKFEDSAAPSWTLLPPDPALVIHTGADAVTGGYLPKTVSVSVAASGKYQLEWEVISSGKCFTVLMDKVVIPSAGALNGDFNPALLPPPFVSWTEVNNAIQFDNQGSGGSPGYARFGDTVDTTPVAVPFVGPVPVLVDGTDSGGYTARSLPPFTIPVGAGNGLYYVDIVYISEPCFMVNLDEIRVTKTDPPVITFMDDFVASSTHYWDSFVDNIVDRGIGGVATSPLGFVDFPDNVLTQTQVAGPILIADGSDAMGGGYIPIPTESLTSLGKYVIEFVSTSNGNCFKVNVDNIEVTDIVSTSIIFTENFTAAAGKWIDPNSTIADPPGEARFGDTAPEVPGPTVSTDIATGLNGAALYTNYSLTPNKGKYTLSFDESSSGRGFTVLVDKIIVGAAFTDDFEVDNTITGNWVVTPALPLDAVLKSVPPIPVPPIQSLWGESDTAGWAQFGDEPPAKSTLSQDNIPIPASCGLATDVAIDFIFAPGMLSVFDKKWEYIHVTVTDKTLIAPLSDEDEYFPINSDTTKTLTLPSTWRGRTALLNLEFFSASLGSLNPGGVSIHLDTVCLSGSPALITLSGGGVLNISGVSFTGKETAVHVNGGTLNMDRVAVEGAECAGVVVDSGRASLSNTLLAANKYGVNCVNGDFSVLLSTLKGNTTAGVKMDAGRGLVCASILDNSANIELIGGALEVGWTWYDDSLGNPLDGIAPFDTLNASLFEKPVPYSGGTDWGGKLSDYVDMGTGTQLNGATVFGAVTLRAPYYNAMLPFDDDFEVDSGITNRWSEVGADYIGGAPNFPVSWVNTEIYDDDPPPYNPAAPVDGGQYYLNDRSFRVVFTFSTQAGGNFNLLNQITRAALVPQAIIPPATVPSYLMFTTPLTHDGNGHLEGTLTISAGGVHEGLGAFYLGDATMTGDPLIDDLTNASFYWDDLSFSLGTITSVPTAEIPSKPVVDTFGPVLYDPATYRAGLICAGTADSETLGAEDSYAVLRGAPSDYAPLTKADPYTYSVGGTRNGAFFSVNGALPLHMEIDIADANVYEAAGVTRISGFVPPPPPPPPLPGFVPSVDALDSTNVASEFLAASFMQPVNVPNTVVTTVGIGVAVSSPPSSIPAVLVDINGATYNGHTGRVIWDITMDAAEAGADGTNKWDWDANLIIKDFAGNEPEVSATPPTLYFWWSEEADAALTSPGDQGETIDPSLNWENLTSPSESEASPAQPMVSYGLYYSLDNGVNYNLIGWSDWVSNNPLNRSTALRGSSSPFYLTMQDALLAHPGALMLLILQGEDAAGNVEDLGDVEIAAPPYFDADPTDGVLDFAPGVQSENWATWLNTGAGATIRSFVRPVFRTVDTTDYLNGLIAEIGNDPNSYPFRTVTRHGNNRRILLPAPNAVTFYQDKAIEAAFNINIEVPDEIKAADYDFWYEWILYDEDGATWQSNGPRAIANINDLGPLDGFTFTFPWDVNSNPNSDPTFNPGNVFPIPPPVLVLGDVYSNLSGLNDPSYTKPLDQRSSKEYTFIFRAMYRNYVDADGNGDPYNDPPIDTYEADPSVVKFQVVVDEELSNDQSIKSITRE